MRNAVLSIFMVVGLALTASAPAGQARASLELRKELPATYNTCSGNGCCYDTPRVRGGVGCVRKTWLWTARPLGDDPNATMGEPVQYRLLVAGWNKKTHGRDASGPQLFGLANADNKVVLQPEHRQLVVISATHAISDVGLIDIRRGKVVRPWGPDLRMPMVFESYEETKVFSGTYPSTRRALPAVISVTAERPNPAVKGGKLCDIAFLNAHGERRWLLENTVCTEGPAAKRLSRRMVIDVQNPGEPIRQVFTDFQGNFLSVTGPVEVFRRYGGYSYEIGGSRPAIKAAGREAARRTVDFPNPLDPTRRWLYQPLDDHGDPLVLGDRVMGVLPVKVTRYSYEDLYGGWMIVELAADDGLRYRFGSGGRGPPVGGRRLQMGTRPGDHLPGPGRNLEGMHRGSPPLPHAAAAAHEHPADPGREHEAVHAMPGGPGARRLGAALPGRPQRPRLGERSRVLNRLAQAVVDKKA